MTLPVQLPNLPDPADEYSKEEMDHLLKVLSLYFQRMNAPGSLRGTILNLSALPTSPYGLVTGDLYQDSNGFVKIIRAYDQFFAAVPTATAHIGAVTTSP